MAKGKTLETVVSILEGIGRAAKKADSKKPSLDRYIDTPLIYAAANSGSIYGACELFEAMECLPLALRVMSVVAIGTVMTPAHKYLFTPLARHAEVIDNKHVREKKGSGVLGWGKTATLLTGIGYFSHGIYGYWTSHNDSVQCITSAVRPAEVQEQKPAAKKDAGSSAPASRPSPVPPVPEDKPKVTDSSFTKQTRKTAKGYNYFRYNDSLTSLVDISDAFDAWDQARGNLCRNTGDRNVRPEGARLYVVADCGDGINGGSNGTKDGTAAKPAVPKKPGQDYTKVDYNDTKLKTMLAKGVFQKGFLNAIEQMCGRLDMNAMALLNIMHHETIGTFRPNIRNPKSTATGLIQFTEQTAKTIGTDLDSLAGMTQLQQLVWVERYFRHYEKGRDYSSCMPIAITVFRPEALKHGLSKVIGERYSKSRSKRRIYRANSHLDKDNSNTLTSREYVHPACRAGYRIRY